VAHLAASGLVTNRADTVIWDDGLRVQRLISLLAFVAVTVFRPAGMVGAVTAVASLGVFTMVTSWGLWTAKVDAADAVVWHDSLGVSEAVAVIYVFVGSSRS
jgi:hypothetical protein